MKRLLNNLKQQITNKNKSSEYIKFITSLSLKKQKSDLEYNLKTIEE